MNIGIEATSAAESQKAGVGYYTYNLIHSMTHLQRAEHQYTLYLRKPWAEFSSLFGTEVKGSPRVVSNVLKFPYFWASVHDSNKLFEMLYKRRIRSSIVSLYKSR